MKYILVLAMLTTLTSVAAEKEKPTARKPAAYKVTEFNGEVEYSHHQTIINGTSYTLVQVIDNTNRIVCYGRHTGDLSCQPMQPMAR